MDERPDVLRGQIEHTRAAIDRDLNRLDQQISARKNLLAAQAQWWTGISAIAAGLLGAAWWWPRQHGRRRARAGYRLSA
jgi:hypothetical protein